MTAHGPVSVWIRGRTPAPPPQLLARIEAMTADVADHEMTADALLTAASRAMTSVLRDGCLTRDSALDLLAVDALVTYAFEAAAEDPADFDARTHRALAAIAALAEPHGP